MILDVLMLMAVMALTSMALQTVNSERYRAWLDMPDER
jgi:hypothetical protein